LQCKTRRSGRTLAGIPAAGEIFEDATMMGRSGWPTN
jgi:hypothetical protein